MHDCFEGLGSGFTKRSEYGKGLLGTSLSPQASGKGLSGLSLSPQASGKGLSGLSLPSSIRLVK
jgi:hypothetical protein